MSKILVYLGLFAFLGCCASRAKGAMPAAVTMVTVEPGVRLEVLDWGGTGRAMVLLAGLGNDAHVFDQFAPKLVAKYHVYGITRRGFGASDSPVPTGDNYSADRLGDDVLAVLDSLKLVKPVLVGHSIAGEELSSIGSRFPDRVAGLVYLDAGYSYAFFDTKVGDLEIQANEVRRRLAVLALPITPPAQQKMLVSEVLAELPMLEDKLVKLRESLKDVADVAAAPVSSIARSRQDTGGAAIFSGMQRYMRISCPVLAIFALPHDRGMPPGAKRDEADASDMKGAGVQADAFEVGIPSAHVVRIAHASHYVFRSNEAEVMRDVDGFVAGLK